MRKKDDMTRPTKDSKLMSTISPKFLSKDFENERQSVQLLGDQSVTTLYNPGYVTI